MELATFYGLVGLMFTVLFLYRYLSNRKYKYPPGPNGYPFVGSAFDISPTNAHVDFTKLGKQYGDVISVKMFGRKIVVLNSSEVIREAFVKEELRDVFAGRPYNFYVKYCDKGPSTTFTGYTDIWKFQRQFLNKSFKIFDGGKHTIENTISQQLDTAVEMIREREGESFNLRDIVIPTLANVIAIQIAGKRFDFQDPALQSMLEFEKVNSLLLSCHQILLLTIFPFLRHLPLRFGKLYHDYHRGFKKYLHYFFDVPKKSFEPGVTRGVVDTLFSFQIYNPWFSDDRIKGILRETVAAGMATTRGSLMAFFLIILHQPEVMNKIQEEIDSYVGLDRRPVLADKYHMPYTEAAIMELLRYVTVAPIGLPHTTNKDVKLRDFFIPEKTLVFANQWAAHHDERVWGDPWRYRPESFLDPQGKIKSVDSTERQNWLAFGVGRRSCLGETFARTRMFLFITTLLQQFDFRSCPDNPPPSHDPRGFEMGITVQDPTFLLRAYPRAAVRQR